MEADTNKTIQEKVNQAEKNGVVHVRWNEETAWSRLNSQLNHHEGVRKEKKVYWWYYAAAVLAFTVCIRLYFYSPIQSTATRELERTISEKHPLAEKTLDPSTKSLPEIPTEKKSKDADVHNKINNPAKKQTLQQAGIPTIPPKTEEPSMLAKNSAARKVKNKNNVISPFENKNQVNRVKELAQNREHKKAYKKTFITIVEPDTGEVTEKSEENATTDQ